MNITPIALPEAAPGNQPSAAQRLSVGDIIQVKVIEKQPDGLFLVRFRGANVLAESSLDLQAGILAIGTVISLEPKPLIRLHSTDGRTELADLLRLLGVPLGKVNLDSLSALLRRSLPVDAASVISLSALVSGLRSVLGVPVSADRLLNLLLSIHAEAGGLQSFLRTVPSGSAFDNLVSQLASQLQGSLHDLPATARDWEALLFLPVWWLAETEAEVKVYRRPRRGRSASKDEGDEEEIRIVIYLDPCPFGPTRIEVTTCADCVEVAIEVTDPAARRFISQRLPILETALYGLGFSEIDLRCAVVSDQTGPFPHFGPAGYGRRVDAVA